jgi:hypothetical protein
MKAMEHGTMNKTITSSRVTLKYAQPVPAYRGSNQGSYVLHLCRLEVQWEACGNDWLSGSDCVGLSASSKNTCQAVCNSESDTQTSRALSSPNLTVQAEG